MLDFLIICLMKFVLVFKLVFKTVSKIEKGTSVQWEELWQWSVNIIIL